MLNLNQETKLYFIFSAYYGHAIRFQRESVIFKVFLFKLKFRILVVNRVVFPHRCVSTRCRRGGAEGEAAGGAAGGHARWRRKRLQDFLWPVIRSPWKPFRESPVTCADMSTAYRNRWEPPPQRPKRTRLPPDSAALASLMLTLSEDRETARWPDRRLNSASTRHV